MNFCLLIPHFHQGKKSKWMLKSCLDSILEYEPQLMMHTFVLDDASEHEDTLKDLDELKLKYRFNLVKKRLNTGYSANINVGLRIAKNLGYHVAVTLNNDVELTSPLTELSRALFSAYPKCGIIGAKLLYPDGRTQHQGFSVTDRKMCDMPEYQTFNATEKSGFKMGVTGAYQILHLGRVGEYPTQYLLAYEDVHFCLKHWERDGQVYYSGEITGIHHESATRGHRPGPKELQSLKTYLAEPFDFEQIQTNLKLAQQCSPHG